MDIRLRKLWKGQMASIKDYEIAEAKKKGGPIVLTYQGMKMTVTDLSQFKPSGQIVASKVNKNQKYELCDIYWKPDKEPEKKEESKPMEGQLSLFTN